MENVGSKKAIKKKIMIAVAAGVLALILVGTLVVLLPKGEKESEPSIITTSTLEKILNVSDLSTFEAIYNGVAKVTNPDDPQEIDYYVSYNATVKAGIDFEQVVISVDEDAKIISVKLPKIKISDITVDIESMDYIFVNDDANTETVSEEAYKKCIDDVTRESNNETAIFELAEQNAKNIVEALIRPFVSSLDSEYQLQIG